MACPTPNYPNDRKEEKVSIYDLQTRPTEGPESQQPTTGIKRRRFSCGGCLLGCLGVLSVFVVSVGVGGWFVWSQLPEWTRNTVVSAVEESNLADEDKQEVIAQVNRLVDGYKDGRISIEQMFGVAEELGNSPLFTLMMANSAHEKYIEPSGLSSDEKEEADLTMHRLARGVFERQIDREELDRPLDYISDKDSNGNRRLKDLVGDEDLRTMLAECKEIADAAGVPKRKHRIDVGDEFKRVVDDALSDKS